MIDWRCIERQQVGEERYRLQKLAKDWTYKRDTRRRLERKETLISGSYHKAAVGHDRGAR